MTGPLSATKLGVHSLPPTARRMSHSPGESRADIAYHRRSATLSLHYRAIGDRPGAAAHRDRRSPAGRSPPPNRSARPIPGAAPRESVGARLAPPGTGGGGTRARIARTG